MWTTCLATVRMLVRRPSVIIWTLAFPIIMATVFLFMFANMRADGVAQAVPVAVVADAAWGASPASTVVEAIAEGEGRLLELTETADAAAARELLADGTVDGIYAVDASGELALTVAPESSAAHAAGRGRSYSVNRSILETIASSYTQSEALLAGIAARDPMALADSAAVARALSVEPASERVALTRGAPDETVRYYYALLGMATMFAAQITVVAVAGIRPTASATAARRSIAGVSRLRQLAGSLVGSWILSFAFLSVAFCYIRLVVGIDFQGREALCLLGVAAGACLACGLGALVGSLPLQGDASVGTGILSGITCVLSLFAGLYGEPAMRFADAVAQAFPLSAWLNPTKLVCDTFYSLYFYDDLMPFAARVAACLVWGAVLFSAAAPLFRRQRYEYL